MSRVIYEFETRGGEVVENASKKFDEALSDVRPIAEAIVRETSGLPSAPAKVEATFGIKLSGELGAILAKSKAEAHIAITLTWQRP